MKTRSQVVRIAMLGICLTAAADTVSAQSLCTCEDWDTNGSFGVVLYQTTGAPYRTVLEPNIGNYYQCLSSIASFGACGAAINLCACEDWDTDGRFGVVLYRGMKNKKPKLLRPNVGNFYDCTAFKASLPQCN